MQLRKKFAVAVAVTATLAVGTAAFAFWTSTGTGRGTGVTATPAGVTIVGGDVDAVAQQLYPGASFDLTLTLQNTNKYPVKVGPVGGVVTVPGDGVPDINDVCKITVHASEGNTDVEAAGVSPGTAAVTVTISMDPAPAVTQEVCKGRLFTIAYTTGPAAPAAG